MGGRMLTRKMYIHITIVSFIIGLMLAIQYNTVQSPEQRETRDVWEIRQLLSEEKDRYSQLMHAIRESSEIVSQYEDAELTDPELILAQTVSDLKKQAGMQAVEGPGLVLSIEPAEELIQFGYEIEKISPDLLTRLVNDLYRFNAEHIEVDGQRISFHTAIRDLNGNTSINGIPILNTSIDIYVITKTDEQAQKLYNHLLASSFRDEFYIDNLQLTIGEVEPSLRIEATVDMPSYAILKEKEE